MHIAFGYLDPCGIAGRLVRLVKSQVAKVAPTCAQPTLLLAGSGTLQVSQTLELKGEPCEHLPGLVAMAPGFFRMYPQHVPSVPVVFADYPVLELEVVRNLPRTPHRTWVRLRDTASDSAEHALDRPPVLGAFFTFCVIVTWTGPQEKPPHGYAIEVADFTARQRAAL